MSPEDAHRGSITEQDPRSPPAVASRDTRRQNGDTPGVATVFAPTSWQRACRERSCPQDLRGSSIEGPTEYRFAETTRTVYGTVTTTG